MKILIIITGSISAYKSLDVISGLIATGHEVKVVVTQDALNFVTEMSLSIISKNKVHKIFDEYDGKVTHIELANWCNCCVVVPATANTIAKINTGLADNLASSVCLVVNGRKDVIKIIVPAMNSKMYENIITQKNIKGLKEIGWIEMEPEVGQMACGDIGKGKLCKPRKIVEFINERIK